MCASLGEAIFAGHLEGRDLGRAIASANVLLNPSVTEAFGNVNLEAMAAGLAVIAVDVGYSISMITHGEDGLLVPANASSFADAVEALMRDKDRIPTIGGHAGRSAR
jgi:glycosyltransferase involved in cell wall biosynthesis